MYKPPIDVLPVTGKKPFIEAVIVCVNYSDFLAHTLPTNRFVFDDIVVVTDKKDKITKQICDFYDVRCVQTDAFYEDGAVFNKAKGINAGLAVLSQKEWVVHMDADIYLPPLMKTILHVRNLDPTCLYGIDRLMCHGFANWIRFLHNPVLINELYFLVQPNAFPLGSRVAHYNQPAGWFAIGFFQLWNPNGSGIRAYPVNSQAADHTDVVFAKLFKPGKNILIPETFVIHLDSGKGVMGENWNGRTSNYFGLVK